MANPSLDIDLEILPPGESGVELNLTTKQDLPKRSDKSSVRSSVHMEEEEDERNSSQDDAEQDGTKLDHPKKDYVKAEKQPLLMKEKVKVSKNEIVEGYAVMLNLTDISYGQKGHNKFYQIQIQKKNGSYCLFTKWGRVGAKNPQSKQMEFSSKIEAIQEFKSKFREKTVNDWDDRERFQPKPGKYTLINVETANSNPDSINKEITMLNKRNNLIKKRIKENASNLEEGVRSLMEMVWDINRMNRTLKGLFTLIYLSG